MLTLQEAMLAVSGRNQNLLQYRSMIPDAAMKAMHLIDQEYASVKKPKGYNLTKCNNKKLGFVYYVRYWHDGRMLPSKWNTNTNDYKKACEYAECQRDTLISGYLDKTGGKVIQFFEGFYDENNMVYQNECRRNGELSEQCRKFYSGVIKNNFLPFLKNRQIRSFEQITVAFLDDFQDVLLAKGIKSKSVNNQMTAVGKVLGYLVRKGEIKTNPYLSLPQIPVKPDERKTHGCYEIESMRGIFDKPWEDDMSCLLNLIIYSTDMRNSEIMRVRKKDIITIGDCRFIDLKESKTENGVRLVPLHDKTYRKIICYAKDMDDEKQIFGQTKDSVFSKASQDLGKMMGVDDEYLKENNITFYSGRHFWKTMMSAGGLGEDAEEVFMGHKVSQNVAKLYNHRDKQGKEILVKKAKEVFKILDIYLFGDK